jgi:hypothetical protein
LSRRSERVLPLINQRIFPFSRFFAVSISLAAARDLSQVSNKTNSLATISLPDW